jgi:hypothetical protein
VATVGFDPGEQIFHRALMQQFRATLIGFATGPLVPAGVFAATSPGLTDNRWPVAFALMPIFYFYALGLTAVFGIPTYLCLRRAGLMMWWSTLIAGAVIGASTMAMIQASVDVSLFGACVGAGEAAVFWIIWRMGRPLIGSERLP